MYGKDYSFLGSDVGLNNCEDVITVLEKVWVEEENNGRKHSLKCGTVHTIYRWTELWVLCSGSEPMISSASKAFRAYVRLRLLNAGLYCVSYTYIIASKVSVTFCIT